MKAIILTRRKLNGRLRFGPNVVLAVGISCVGYLGSMLSSILVARLLGVAGRGLFALFQETAFAIFGFANLGMGMGQIYHVSTNPKKIKHFMATAYVFAITVGVGMAGLYITLGMFWNLQIVRSLDLQGGLLLITLAPIMLIINFQRQYFLATHAYKKAKANFALTMSLPAIAYLAIYSFDQVTVLRMIYGYVLAQIFTMILFQLVLAQSIYEKGSFSLSFAREALSFGLPFYVAELCQYLSQRADFFVVAWFMGKSGLGLFSVAMAVADVIARLNREIGTILFPAFASGSIPKGGGIPILRKIIFLSVLLATVLLLSGETLVLLMFGNDFREAVPIFRVLLVRSVAISIIQVTWHQLVAGGRVFWGVPLFASSALLDIVLSVLLVHNFGLVGAAIASTFSSGLAACVLLGIFVTKEGCRLRDVLVINTMDIKSIVMAFRGIQVAS
jgi:O-antigen/teichoic acid export membrane protein